MYAAKIPTSRRITPTSIWFYGNPNGKANIWMRPYKRAEEPDQEYPFYLTSMRVIDHWHTATMTGKVPELLKATPPRLWK